MALAALDIVTRADAQAPLTIRMKDGGTLEVAFVQSIPPLAPVTVPATAYALTPLALNLRTGTALVSDLTTYALSAPVPLINLRLVANATPYALTAPAPIVTRVALTVQADATLIGVTPAGSMSVTITSPAAYVGTFTVDQSNEGGAANLNSNSLLTAPQCLVKPAISGIATVGSTLTAVPDLWIYDADDTPSLSGQWYRGASPISGATGLTYVVQAADAGAAITYRGELANAGTTRTATSNTINITAGQSIVVPVTTYGLTAPEAFVNLGVWSITAGNTSATVNSFPAVPTSPAWSVTAGNGSATINAYPGGA